MVEMDSSTLRQPLRPNDDMDEMNEVERSLKSSVVNQSPLRVVTQNDEQVGLNN